MLPSDFAAWHLEEPLPSPSEQLDLLVLYVGENQPSPAEAAVLKAPVISARIEVAIMRPPSEAGLGWLLEQQETARFLEKRGEQNGSLLLRLNMAGWLQYAVLKQDRVHTSCLGFGDEYNEDLLDDLSKAAGGALHDADSPERFPEIFRQELDSLLKLSAQNVRVRLKKLHYCTGVSVISDYPSVTLPEGGLEITLGDLVSEEERALVLALEVLPIPNLPDGAPAASSAGG